MCVCVFARMLGLGCFLDSRLEACAGTCKAHDGLPAAFHHLKLGFAAPAGA